MDRLITTNDALEAACNELAASAYITVDTEFIRERTYFPRLCLVQLASPEGAEYAVDPLADGLSLAPLLALMAKPDVLKVMHACKQDMEIFYQLMDAVPAPIYDTQVAAMVCGYGEQVGYEALVDRILGEPLDKASRYTDWAQRPLTERQVNYAIADVTHLRGVYESLRDEIAAKGREGWIVEEMAKVQQEETYRVQPDDVWRRLKYKNRRPAHLNVLRSIAAWRENAAIRKDIPRSRLMKDEVLLQIAAMNPSSLEDMAQVRGAMKNISGDNAKAILAAIAEARALPESEWPKDEKKRRMINPQQEILIDILKLLLKLQCDEAGVASRLVANKDDLASYVLKEDVPFAHGWRYELFGHLAEAFLIGKLSLQADAKGNGIAFSQSSD
jgi:ribonuclease D